MMLIIGTGVATRPAVLTANLPLAAELLILMIMTRETRKNQVIMSSSFLFGI